VFHLCCECLQTAPQDSLHYSPRIPSFIRFPLSNIDERSFQELGYRTDYYLLR
jgi:hypothetical protein